VAACQGPEASDTEPAEAELADTDVDLTSLPEGIFFTVDGRGYSFVADWGPTGSSPPRCQRVAGGVEVYGVGPYQGSSGNQDYIYVRACGVPDPGGPVTLRAAVPIVEPDAGACYATALWDGTFGDREGLLDVRTFPADAAESERTCRLRALVTADEVALTFQCPTFRTPRANEEDRGEPVAISGTARCALVDAP